MFRPPPTPIDPPASGAPASRSGAARSTVRTQARSTGFYLGCIVALLIAKFANLLPRADVVPILVYDLVGVAFFHFLIRCRWDVRVGLPGLPVPQLVYGILSLGVAYVSVPEVRNSVLFIAPLVLMFSAFSTPPRYCRWLGYGALGVIGASMVVTSMQSPHMSQGSPGWVELLLAAVVFPTAGHLAGVLSGIRFKLKAKQAELREALARIQVLATCDALTGLPNRRHAMDRLEAALDGMRRRATPLCIGLIDIDHFKSVNDSFGHAAGDAVLRALAAKASSTLRQTDLVARWGGEEFLIVLPDTDLSTARDVLERLKQQVTCDLAIEGHPGIGVTFSAGVTLAGIGDSSTSVVERADRLLYDAKENGRDRIVTSDAGDRGSRQPAEPAMHRS